MIFVVDGISSKNAAVYDNVEDLTSHVEWQDILDDSINIIDEQGRLYKWDKSKKEEVGTVYGYTLIQVAEKKYEYIEKLLESYNSSDNKFEFEFKI